MCCLASACTAAVKADISSLSQSAGLTLVLAMQDTLNEASLAAVTDLQTGRWAGVETQKRALQVTMLTGDNEASARHFSQVPKDPPLHHLAASSVWKHIRPDATYFPLLHPAAASSVLKGMRPDMTRMHDHVHWRDGLWLLVGHWA